MLQSAHHVRDIQPKHYMRTLMSGSLSYTPTAPQSYANVLFYAVIRVTVLSAFLMHRDHKPKRPLI